MPIRLTWIPPPTTSRGSNVIGYKLYKTGSPGPLTPQHFFRLFESHILTYDDYEYNRRYLEAYGYLYKVTAFTLDNESDFTLSNEIHIQYPFEDFVSREEWEYGFTEAEILELFENWDLTLPTSPVQQYSEPWEYSRVAVLRYEEPWNNYETLLWREPWERYFEYHEDFLWYEPWERTFEYHGDFLWSEPWES